jgi:RNase P subunit RPR2
MKTKLTRQKAIDKIDEFFKREEFHAEEIRKIKKLAMKFNIKLGVYRRNFCKKCLSKLKGNIKVSKTHKTIDCKNCGYKNKYTLEISSF